MCSFVALLLESRLVAIGVLLHLISALYVASVCRSLSVRGLEVRK